MSMICIDNLYCISLCETLCISKLFVRLTVIALKKSCGYTHCPDHEAPFSLLFVNES